MFPDALALGLSAITAYQVRFNIGSQTDSSLDLYEKFEYSKILFLVVIIWLVVLISAGTYRFSHVTQVSFNLSMIFKRTFTYFLALGFLSFIFKASFSRIIFLLMLFSGLIYLLLIRLCLHFFIIRPLIFQKKIFSNLMIIGRTKIDLQLYSDWIINNRRYGFSVVSRLLCNNIDARWVDEFDRVIRYKEVTEILFLPGMESDSNFSKLIHYSEDKGLNINWIPLNSGNLGYWLIPTAQEGIPFLTFEKSAISLPWRFAKRVFDLIFATLFLLIFSPVFLLIAILVLLTSGWPIFYSQTRVGLNGKTFKFYKFRSMIKDADQRLSEVENVHKRDHVIFKSKDDPRVTPIGKILRKYSLDELPQFFNVLNNSMSVVGPRPALTREVSLYNSTYERRLNAKPGITGPWQISGRSDLDL
ncbi:MAG: exopolysaccharide biosynthesis polyprenyl glycosylphosphotransferase, partial [Alphaproteobacteria bacterium]|nr:exopolysaccharide biosynthesis polyprenyl glycosylphosphotransferase [Alphaproteobacteria bacterium]